MAGAVDTAHPATPDPQDDFAGARLRVLHETDGDYRRFLMSLKADYGQVWRDIFTAYAVLTLTLAAIAAAPVSAWTVVVVLGGAAVIGYCLAFIQLFLHEAAHYNIAADRKWNDRLANTFIAWHLGADIGDYRLTHFTHHRDLGRRTDSERSYFHALTPHFILEMLTGVHALRVFLGRGGDAPRARAIWPIVRGGLAHILLLAGLIWLGAWPSALSWVLAVGVFLPFYMTLRQILEHRRLNADPAADYSRVDHGAHTRMFKDSVVSRTFGGAGFSRHLLHHWEPHISYTRLRELEIYLRRTSAGATIESHTTSYAGALAGLLAPTRIAGSGDGAQNA